MTSGSFVYGADSCPQDSVIGYDQKGDPISKTLYTYDDAGRTLCEEKWVINTDSVLIGSTKTTTEYYPNGKIKSTATWRWSTMITPNGWIGDERKDYTYDDKGNTISWSIYSWSTDKNDWINSSKCTTEYNSSNKQILQIYYKGQNTNWIPLTKAEADYDTNGNQILNRYWGSYDVNSNSWIGKYWYEYAYNTKNQRILYAEYSWLDNSWSGKSKQEYDYDNAGRVIYRCQYSSYDASTDTWTPQSKSYLRYDQYENEILQEYYVWNEDYWKGYSKSEYEFDGFGNQLAEALYAWDDTNRKWIGVSKTKTLYDENENLILDEQYNWSNDDWAGSKKEEYIYDANKQILSTVAYQWDATNKQWNYNTKVLADYNSNKMQILDERYTWNVTNQYWKGTQKDSTVYNAKNVETESYSYQWDDTNRRWLGNSKYRKEFDAANNLILEEQYTWTLDPSIPEGGFWHGDKKEEYAYNAAKQQTLAIIYAWSDIIEDWIGNTKKISDYDKNKNQILNEQYTWVVEATATGGYWQGTEKATYTFNKNKQQTSSWVYAWNDADTAWVYATRDTASYDARKNQTLDERYTWDAENEVWVGTLKKEYGYNADGQQVMFAYYAWDMPSQSWQGTQKEEDEQDDEGRTIMKATYTWGTTDWKGKSKDTYTYFRNDTIYEHITYEWKSSKWIENNSTIDSYSETGQHISTATFKYDATNSVWVGQKLTAWAYTESGKIYIQEDYVWGTTDWVKTTRLVNTYTDEKITSYTTFKWENEEWVKVKHWEQVDANTERTYEWYNNAWSITQEKTKTYTDGLLTLELNQNWNHGVQTAGSKTEYTYTGSNLTQKSSYTYESTWVETDRIANTYDTDNRLTNTTTYKRNGSDLQYVSKTDSEYSGTTTIVSNWQWDVTNQAWVGTTKEEKEYGTGKDVTITASEWNTTSQSWQGVSKTGYTYYASGKEKYVIDYRWTGSAWVADTKTEYEYSGSKNIVTATYLWENSDWVGQTKTGYYYDEGEAQTTATWTWTGGKWVGESKVGETFDSDGNQTGKTTYTWNGTAFVYKQKTEIEYGSSSKDKTTATYNWNTTSQSWQGVSKSGVTYNGAKISSETSYTWVSGFTWRYNKKTEYEYGTNANDKTTAVYTWDTTSQSWQGVSKSGSTYASNGKIASEFSYTWGDGDWVGVKKTEYEYGDGKNNSVAQYVWGTTAWVGKSKVTENYTEQGDSLSFYTYCWKNDDWADSLKQEYEYNQYGDKILYLYSQYINGVWKNFDSSTKREIVYHDYELGLITSDAKYTWSSKKNMWVGKGNKIEYEYDSENRLVKTTQSTWSGKAWQYTTRLVKGFNENGQFVLNAQMKWDTSKKDWMGIRKNEYGYDANGNQIMQAVYGWNKSVWKWEGSTKTETTYNDEGIVTMTCSYDWNYDVKKWDWKGMAKTEYEYDPDGRLRQIIYSFYDTAWYYNEKIEYQYDQFGIQVMYNSYCWVNDQWILQTSIQSMYDEDQAYKLRSDFNASWNSEGNVTSYIQKYYYYACDPKYTITVNAKDDAGGVTGSGTYTYYARPKIAAVNDSCATFEQWTDGETAAKRSIIVTEDKTYTAQFKPIVRTIKATVATGEGGYVSIKRKTE